MFSCTGYGMVWKYNPFCYERDGIASSKVHSEIDLQIHCIYWYNELTFKHICFWCVSLQGLLKPTVLLYICNNEFVYLAKIRSLILRVEIVRNVTLNIVAVLKMPHTKFTLKRNRFNHEKNEITQWIIWSMITFKSNWNSQNSI